MKESTKRSVSFTVGAVLLLASPAIAQELPPPSMQMAEATQRHVRTIGMEEYRTLVDNPGSALIVDVREPEEFAAGHVPGAINIPRGLISSHIWNYVGSSEQADKDRSIILQCRSGKRATLAAQTLEELGFTHTTAVIMGLDAWEQAGNPFVK